MKRKLAAWAVSACLCVACAKKHKSSQDGSGDGASIGAVGGAVGSAVSGPSTTFPQWPTLDVQTLVGDAYASGQKSVTIPAGNYLVQANGSPCLRLIGFKDFTINAAGVTLHCSDQLQTALRLDDCSNVTINGLTVDYANPVFTQGTITAVATDKSSLDFDVDDGYPTYLENSTYFPSPPGFIIYDAATSLIKVGSHDFILKDAVVRLGPKSFRLLTPYGNGNGAAGDRFTSRGNAAWATMVTGSSGIVFDAYTVHGGNAGVVELFGQGGNVYHSLQVTQGPLPVGATKPRLLSTNADGFHSSGVGKGAQIDHALFELTGDDGLNINGFYGKVVAVSGSVATVGGIVSTPASVGDTLRFLDESTGALLGEAKVTAVGPPLTGYTPPLPVTIAGQASTNFYQVTLDDPAPAKAGAMYWNANANGAGFTLTDSTIRNNHGRGLLIDADDARIIGNTFDGNSASGILSVYEPVYGESGPVRNLIIQGNTIENVGRSAIGTDRSFAIKMSGLMGQNHQNVQIIGNTISSNYDYDVWIEAATGVTIENNTFGGKTDAQIAALGADLSQRPAVKLMNVSNVTLGGNSYPAGQIAVGTGSAVTNVSGETVTPLAN